MNPVDEPITDSEYKKREATVQRILAKTVAVDAVIDRGTLREAIRDAYDHGRASAKADEPDEENLLLTVRLIVAKGRAYTDQGMRQDIERSITELFKVTAPMTVRLVEVSIQKPDPVRSTLWQGSILAFLEDDEPIFTLKTGKREHELGSSQKVLLYDLTRKWCEGATEAYVKRLYYEFPFDAGRVQ